MPDISMLIPIANVFGVSTDVLLEVNVKGNEEHIRDFTEHTVIFEEPYGTTIEEKLTIYREEIRRFPQSAELNESLVGLLILQTVREGPFPDPALYKEMADLGEEILALSGGRAGISECQSTLCARLLKIGNTQRAAEIAGSTAKTVACREVLLPGTLSGRKQFEARKDLIFKCTDRLINTVHDMYKDNSEELTEEEWHALEKAEHVVEAVYGKDFSDHFVLCRHWCSAVQGSLKRGLTDEAVTRPGSIVDKMKMMETVSAKRNPLVQDYQMYELYTMRSTVFSISLEAKWLLECIERDFVFDGVPSLKEINPRFSAICGELEQLRMSDNKRWIEDDEIFAVERFGCLKETVDERIKPEETSKD